MPEMKASVLQLLQVAGQELSLGLQMARALFYALSFHPLGQPL